MNEMTMLDSKGSYGENGTSEPKAAKLMNQNPRMICRFKNRNQKYITLKIRSYCRTTFLIKCAFGNNNSIIIQYRHACIKMIKNRINQFKFYYFVINLF
ncbi:MAG: hypothetical protein IPI04_02905 [Ignavibacteria bacterium]|nr:hypothetical protein [Ignavibacteria bacterium]